MYLPSTHVTAEERGGCEVSEARALTLRAQSPHVGSYSSVTTPPDIAVAVVAGDWAAETPAEPSFPKLSIARDHLGCPSPLGLHVATHSQIRGLYVTLHE